MTKATPLADRIEWWPRENVRMSEHNVRAHGEAQLEQLAAGMREVWTMPLLVVEDSDRPKHGEIIAGHGRFLASERAGYNSVKVLVAENWTVEQIDRYRLFDNQIALLAEWDEEQLITEIKRIRDNHGLGAVASLGWDQDALDAMLNPKPPTRDHDPGSLARAFGVPPFSVLDAASGWWQERKRAWIGLGIQSEMGRADHVEGNASHRAAPGGGGRMYGGRRSDGSFGAANTKYGGSKRGAKK